jgi:hypothetical protein
MSRTTQVRLKRWRTACLLIIGLILATSTRSALADVAPPEPPPGGNPAPAGEQTQVRMASETVTLLVQSINAAPQRLAGDVARAKVTADFTMHNEGEAAEAMQVRFPLANPSGMGDGFFNFPEITDLTAAVDGQTVPTTRVETPNPAFENDPPVAWAGFDVTFPPGQDVMIEVKYTQQAEGYLPLASFTYILETGAGWQGTIGSADVIVRLPYEANALNTVDDVPWGGPTTAGREYAGDEVRWHFEDFEPQPGGNVMLGMVAPYAWQVVLDARAAVEAHPDDGDAWGALARAYKTAAIMDTGKRFLRDDPGGQELYQSSVEAYEKATSLLPNVARWHAGYAELLIYKYDSTPELWDNWQNDPYLIDLAKELHTAIQLDPNNQQAQQLLEEASLDAPYAISPVESGYDFLILTPTETAEPSETAEATDTPVPMPSATAAATSTAAPPMPASPTSPATESVSASPSPPPSATPASGQAPFCGAAVGVPLLVAVGAVRRRRRLKK